MPTLNTNPAATLAAAEGLAALGVGDTALARRKYAEAGAILEREMKAHDGGSEKQLLRFLAATQYYKGGDYRKAQELATKIDGRALPKNVRGLLPQFLKDVKERASPGYEISIRRALLGLWQQNKPAEQLAVLQEHPYVLTPGHLAFARAVLCGELANFRAAALFFAGAIHRTPDDVELVLTTAAHPLLLLKQGRLNEAWEYSRYQVELIPHPITYTTASIVGYHRAVQAPAEERGKCFDEQLTFAQQAWDAYQKLTTDQKNHRDTRAYVAFGVELTAVAWWQQGSKERSREAWDQAVQLGANPANPWASRAFAMSASKQTVAAPEDDYLSEQEAHFSARFAPDSAIRERLEVVEA